MDLKRLLGLTKDDVRKIADDAATAAAAKAATDAGTAAQAAVENIAASLAAVRDLPPIVTDGLLVAAEYVFVGEGVADRHRLLLIGGIRGEIERMVWDGRGGMTLRPSRRDDFVMGSTESNSGSGDSWPHKRYKVIVAFIPCPDEKP